MTRPRVLIPLGPGVEELEAIAPADLLRRADCHVVTASVGTANPVTGRNRLRLMADIDVEEALAEWGSAWDLVVLPGGMGGVEAIESCEPLMALLQERLERGQPVAAICAAPRALARAGLSRETPITSHPGVRDVLSDFTDYREDPVVDAGPVVTSRGPGTAVPFALACVRLVRGPDVAARIAAEIAYPE